MALGTHGFLRLVCFIKLVIDFKLVESKDSAFLDRVVTSIDTAPLLLYAKWSHGA